MSQGGKCFNIPMLYTTNTLLQLFNKQWIYFFFFSSFDMYQSHQLLVCYATTGINSLFNVFMFFPFFKINTLDKKSVLIRLKIENNLVGKKSVLIREKIKTICLTKKLFWLEKKLKQFA